jgi:hypothetical protein
MVKFNGRKHIQVYCNKNIKKGAILDTSREIGAEETEKKLSTRRIFPELWAN